MRAGLGTDRARRSRRDACGWSCRPRPGARRTGPGCRGCGSRRRSRSARRGDDAPRARRRAPPGTSSTRGGVVVDGHARPRRRSARRAARPRWVWREPRAPRVEVVLEVRVAARRRARPRSIAARGSGARPRFVWTITPVALSTGRRLGGRSSSRGAAASRSPAGSARRAARASASAARSASTAGARPCRATSAAASSRAGRRPRAALVSGCPPWLRLYVAAVNRSSTPAAVFVRDRPPPTAADACPACRLPLVWSPSLLVAALGMARERLRGVPAVAADRPRRRRDRRPGSVPARPRRRRRGRRAGAAPAAPRSERGAASTAARSPACAPGPGLVVDSASGPACCGRHDAHRRLPIASLTKLMTALRRRPRPPARPARSPITPAMTGRARLHDRPAAGDRVTPRACSPRR